MRFLLTGVTPTKSGHLQDRAARRQAKNALNYRVAEIWSRIKPDSPHLLAPKIKASYYFAIAANDDQRQPDAKDKLRDAFAGAAQPVKIEVYQDCQHGWCVSDDRVYNKTEADRAFGELVALYAKALA